MESLLKSAVEPCPREETNGCAIPWYTVERREVTS